MYGFHGTGSGYFGWIPEHEKSISASNSEKQLRGNLVTYLLMQYNLGAESLYYDIEVFQKCLEMCKK